MPFAFCIAALITGHLDDSWLRAVRRWTMISWFFLSLGLTLGMIWAYEELGWGGFWGWDPVENAGLLPWFTATAFLHSVMVQERRGMLRVWNVTLVIVTFFLTLFGTFMTRSGIVQSVHAFGEDRELALMFTLFMSFTLLFSFGWVIYRLPLLKARNELDSWVVEAKRRSWPTTGCCCSAAAFVLFATMFPTLSEAIAGERLTVGPPFFNAWMTPVGLILLLLTGIGPLLAWRWSTLANLRAAVPVADRRRPGRRGDHPRARHPGVEFGHLLRAVRVRRRHHRPGVHPRRRGAAGRAPAPICSPRWSGWSRATSGATAATSCTSASS